MPWPADSDGRLPLVLIPGAGGFYARTDGVVEACKAHGETVLLDYPELQWHFRRTDLGDLAAEMHARLRARMGHRSFVLAGESLGAIVAALIVQHDRHELRVARFVAIDPFRAQASEIQSGWLARNLGRARRAGGSGLPAFVWVRLNRSVARILAPRLRRKSRMAMLVAQLFARTSPAIFGRQLRMRLLIDHAAAWRLDQGGATSGVPCTVLHTSSKIPDAAFWEPRFQTLGFIGIKGDHDTWIDFDGPQLLLDQWDAACAPAKSGPVLLPALQP